MVRNLISCISLMLLAPIAIAAAEPNRPPPQAATPDDLSAACVRGNDIRSSDLCAQWKAADAAAESVWWSKTAGLVGIAGLIGVFGALYFAGRSNKILKETSQLQLRAYMYAAELQLHPVQVNGAPHWVPQIKWKNGGQTPAHHVITDIGWKTSKDNLPDNFNFHAECLDLGTATVGPDHVTYSTSTNKIAVSIHNEIAEGRTKVFLWGSIKYKDVFGADRETKMAAQMTCEVYDNGLFSNNWATLDRHNSMK